MITDKVLYGEKVFLRQIERSDCVEKYVEWLNDTDINRYLETRWTRQTLESIKEFVCSQRENDHSVLFAIIWAERNQHIGNIKIGPVNMHHHHADISYFIGEKKLWGGESQRKRYLLYVILDLRNCVFIKLKRGRMNARSEAGKRLRITDSLKKGILEKMFYWTASL